MISKKVKLLFVGGADDGLEGVLELECLYHGTNTYAEALAKADKIQLNGKTLKVINYEPATQTMRIENPL